MLKRQITCKWQFSMAILCDVMDHWEQGWRFALALLKRAFSRPQDVETPGSQQLQRRRTDWHNYIYRSIEYFVLFFTTRGCLWRDLYLWKIAFVATWTVTSQSTAEISREMTSCNKNAESTNLKRDVWHNQYSSQWNRIVSPRLKQSNMSQNWWKFIKTPNPQDL